MNATLSKQAFVVVREFLDQRLARILYDVLLLREWRGESKRDDQVTDAHSFWGDSTLDALLVGLMPDVEQVACCPLLPTYSYARLYLRGNSLPRHRDRQACEIAVTIHLGHTGAALPPPICFEPDIAVTQRPGDAVIYLGDRIDHWREPFTGTRFGQVFLNYVRADGTRRHYAHDGRQSAFPPVLGVG